MIKYYNEKLFNAEMREFFEKYKSKIMVKVDDIGDSTVTLTLGLGDDGEFYMTFGSLILAKGWTTTIESPKLIFNLSDFIKLSFS